MTMDWTRGHILGRGSSAAVSIATSVSDNQVFAVKSTELSQSEFLQREQKFLSFLSSPYLVGYRGYDITREADNKLMYNLFMEYMSGGTVIDAAHNQFGGVIKEAMIVHYTRHIVQGLEYLHSNGVVHCDIKGRNILVGESGAKIADLGCAKWANQAGVPIGGTPMFMAPEVARGEEQGFPADIWALGCTVIEMATGGSPWSSDDPMSILYQIAYSGQVPEIPDFLSDQGKDFVRKCLRRDQTERWTAKELLKHPFLELEVEESNWVQGKEKLKDLNTSSSSVSVSVSPTSILDQDIWNSSDEQIESCGWSSCSSAKERMEGLSCNSREANWGWEETWMTIRECECGPLPLTGWVGDEMDVEVEVDFNVSLDIKVRRCCSNNNISTMSCRGCDYFSNNNIFMGCCCYTCVQNTSIELGGTLLNLDLERHNKYCFTVA